MKRKDGDVNGKASIPAWKEWFHELNIVHSRIVRTQVVGDMVEAGRRGVKAQSITYERRAKEHAELSLLWPGRVY